MHPSCIISSHFSCGGMTLRFSGRKAPAASRTASFGRVRARRGGTRRPMWWTTRSSRNLRHGCAIAQTRCSGGRAMMAPSARSKGQTYSSKARPCAFCASPSASSRIHARLIWIGRRTDFLLHTVTTWLEKSPASWCCRCSQRFLS